MANTYATVDTTCTTINESPKYARLPERARGYLQEKVESALKAPRLVQVRLPDGATLDTWLKQVVVSATIRRDERDHNYFFRYKAEVSFDMSALQLDGAPIPFLSSGPSLGPKNPGRRHSLNPFPPGRKTGLLRRPDVIIVKNEALRWPGRGVIDHDGQPHPDNLLRLVEIKFPGDGWAEGQEDAYQLIAGGRDRMSVLDVSDCEGDVKKAKEAHRQSQQQPQPHLPPAFPPVRRRPDGGSGTAPAPVPARPASAARLRAPVRTTQPIAKPVWYENWVPDVSHARTEIAEAIDALWNGARQGFSHLSAQAQAWLRQSAPWVFQSGRWVHDTGVQAWTWVDAQGRALYRYSAEQIRAGWKAIQEQTDLTWEVLKKVQWGQLLMDLAKGAAVVCVVVLLVAGILVIAVVGAEVVALLLALAAIVGQAVAAAAATAAGAAGTATLAALGALLGAQRLASQ